MVTNFTPEQIIHSIQHIGQRQNTDMRLADQEMETSLNCSFKSGSEEALNVCDYSEQDAPLVLYQYPYTKTDFNTHLCHALQLK